VNDPFVPIDVRAVASRLKTKPELLFGRLYYHLESKHRYKPLRIETTRRVVSIRCSRSPVPQPEQRLATERDGECLERIGRSTARRGCASEYGVRKLADQTHSGGCQGSIDGLARAGEWLPRSFFGQRATVSLRPSGKSLQVERHEEEMKWRAGGASIPTRNPHSPQPACHRSRQGATSPDCPGDAATAHHSSVASRHSAGKSGVLVSGARTDCPRLPPRSRRNPGPVQSEPSPP